MPAMTLLGWFHTIMGIAALLLAVGAISRHGVIKASTQLGGAYLVVTAIVAGSALGIYNQGGFGIAHILALLTLGAALGGFLLERFHIFGAASRYFQAIAYSATILFHMIPALQTFCGDYLLATHLSTRLTRRFYRVSTSHFWCCISLVSRFRS